jgi:hypothetical protein
MAELRAEPLMLSGVETTSRHTRHGSPCHEVSHGSFREEGRAPKPPWRRRR